MIKAIFGMTDDDDEEGTSGILLGLSKKNVAKLMAGEPIYVKGNDGESAWPFNMIIMYGETEEDIVSELQEKANVFGISLEGMTATKH